MKKIILAVSFLLAASGAHAALVDTDWKTEGDRLAFVDTQTGIEWMKTEAFETIRTGHTVSDLFNDVETIAPGWRMATFEEITSLYDSNLYYAEARQSAAFILNGRSRYWNYGYKYRSTQVSARFGYNKIGTTFKYFDFTYINQHGNIAGAYLWDDNSSSGQHGGSNRGELSQETIETNGANFVFYVSDGGTTRSSQLDPSINANNANAPINDVSSPVALGLVGLGLFGFAARRRTVVASINHK